MNDILDTVALVLAPHISVPLLKGMLADKPDELVALFQYNSEPPDEYFDQTHFNYNVQARTRSKTPERAAQLAKTALGALHRYTDDAIVITAKSSVLGIGQDEKQRFEYTINFSIFQR